MEENVQNSVSKKKIANAKNIKFFVLFLNQLVGTMPRIKRKRK